MDLQFAYTDCIHRVERSIGMKFKKPVVALVILCLVLFMGIVTVGCSSKGICDSCGQEDTLNTYKTKSGEKLRLCDFCFNGYKLMGE